MAAFSRARRRIPQKLKLVGRSVHRLFFVFPDGDDLFGQFVEDGQNGLQNERFDLLFDLVRDPDIVHVNIPFSVLQNGAAA